MNVVAHNLSSMFTNRQLGITTDNRAKSAEKLSSGYKINRAADDAAGLSISEKMRKKIRGLNQGSENMQDGVSLCQVADGALAEIQDMLQRMTQLAVKAANGTNSESDRADINQEINKLKIEIDRIADTTKFNEGIYPLKHHSSTYYDETIIPGGVIKPDSINIDIDFNDVHFDARPFNENTPLDTLSLFAKISGTGTIADGRYYSLLYTGSESVDSDYVLNGYSSRTSAPSVIFSTGTVSKSVNFNNSNFKFKSYTEDIPSGKWERVFSYTDRIDPNISFDIKQTVSMNSSANSYKLDTSLISTGSTPITNSVILMNLDTSYKGDRNGDANEGYYIDNGGSHPDQVMKESVYTDPLTAYDLSLANQLGSEGEVIRDLYNKAIVGTITTDGDTPNSFIVGAKDSSEANSWMPFSLEVSLNKEEDTNSNFLILGEYTGTNKLDTLSSYSGTGSGVEIYGIDHAFTYGTFGSNSISFGIVNPAIIDPVIPERLPDTIIRNKRIVEQKDVRIQCSDESDDAIFINLVDSTLKGIGLDGADVSTVDSSLNTIDLVNHALGKVNDYRSSFGAQQNRLEHAIKVNDNSAENTQAAESRIRDTDMASEMVKYSKDSILQQAGQSMLAQANQDAESVLQLLQ